jgi:hypothetical protein
MTPTMLMLLSDPLDHDGFIIFCLNSNCITPSWHVHAVLDLIMCART